MRPSVQRRDGVPRGEAVGAGGRDLVRAGAHTGLREQGAQRDPDEDGVRDEVATDSLETQDIVIGASTSARGRSGVAVEDDLAVDHAVDAQRPLLVVIRGTESAVSMR